MLLWGEFEKKETKNLDFIDKIVKSASLDPNLPLQAPSLKKFKHSEPEPVSSKYFQSDPVSINTLHQIKYSTKQTNWLNGVLGRKKGVRMDEDLEPIEPPPISNIHYQKSPLSSINRVSSLLNSNFSRGIFEVPHIINNKCIDSNIGTKTSKNAAILDVSGVHADVIRGMLRRSLAVICFNAGFTECDESCLDVLCGVFHYQITSLCTKISISLRSNTTLQTPEAVTKVFLECGLGHPDDLIGWYESHVVNHNKRVSNQNEALYERCLRKQKELMSSSTLM